MKKILLILAIILANTENAKAQTGVPDTLAYLQSVVDNKAQYIGQPFSTLLNNLQVQIKYFHPRRHIIYDISKETSTRFAFYFPQDGLDDYYLTYPSLEISWQTSLNANQSDIFWNNSDGGGWTTAVANFYSSGIIADIKIRD